MTKGKKHIRDVPHSDPEQEIDWLIKNISDEVKNDEFISAHYKLKRLLHLIESVSKNEYKMYLKKKYQQLNNELNINIITYLSELRKKNTKGSHPDKKTGKE